MKLLLIKRFLLLGSVLVVGAFYYQFETIFQHVDEALAEEVKDGVRIGNQALPIEGKTLRGDGFHLQQLQGKLVVVNFFASWCHPCQEEMPLIVDLERKLKENGSEFVAINLTSQERSLLDVKPFLDNYQASFDPVLDSDGKIMQDYQIIGIPTTLVIDQNGLIVQRIDGMLTPEIIEDLIPLRNE
ncbi:alkyl hydroperoxide reductase [Alkalihalobacillus alcalophilus ATCC 27647 = CGMCC 1.3604]|uniref:Alkyl hydroperoxide reductase n=1 Tax=Alkalihalobacillus alcalophilus ATCC 27647 = CGMCC 1.3604 TaxID=1218173 RepID=A0A4S4K239_ALKAL|nr:TlpA disulfide reductase family protein [Alkalihalobacillus alcalophilus]MED1561245.1 TlpA disulfide reductase family protein [Alkalihalobacillus alcalophilus]THG91708.1 alkyl hydroperoxide reductase [Alkalihalobacillus alcalophilus ATCC 27647 = CGMCC 1.3604]